MKNLISNLRKRKLVPLIVILVLLVVILWGMSAVASIDPNIKTPYTFLNVEGSGSAGEVAFFDGAATGIEAVVRGWGPLKVLCAGVMAPFFMMN